MAVDAYELRSAGDGGNCRVVFGAGQTDPVPNWSRKTGLTKAIAISPDRKCPKSITVNGTEYPLAVFNSYRIDGYVFYAIRPEFTMVFYKAYGNNYRFRAINIVKK